METSLSIHPDRFGEKQEQLYFTPGNAVDVHRGPRGVAVNCERGTLHALVCSDDTIRIVYDRKSREPDSGSYAVVMQQDDVFFDIEQTTEQVLLHTAQITVRIGLSPVRVDFIDRATGVVRVAEAEQGIRYTGSGEIGCAMRALPGERFYGFGEKAGFLDKSGERLGMWNTDVYAPHNPETNELYVSIPYYLSLRGAEAYGLLLDNTFRTSFDMRNPDEIRFHAEGGALNYYYLAGPEAKRVQCQLGRLIGTAPLPPKWSLGYHQSRYSYETEAEVRRLADTFVQKEIPLDAIYLDIHYMDGYRVFTVDEGRFPTFADMNAHLRGQGIRLVTIVDPGVKDDPEYEVYREGMEQQRFCKNMEGEVFHGPVWPGRSAFPDFTSGEVRRWWGSKQQVLTDAGVSGIWNDMNEPSVFNESKTMDLHVVHDNDGRGGTHRELHNVYGMAMAKASYEGLLEGLDGERPFVLTRAGYAGIQRYAAVWTGDNRSFWEHLQMMIPMCLNLGLSGVPFCGADVGGFAHDTQGDLLVRWTQAAAFTPYFRNHSEIKCARQEPWMFDSETERLVAEAIRLRYRWMPQLYLLMEEAARTGVPIMRPMFLEYPDDEEAWRLSDQFMFGDNVLVAPMLRPDSTRRSVYLPEGIWIDYWSGERLAGGRYALAHAPLARIPLYVRAGSALLEENVRPSTAVPAEELTVHLYLPDNAGSAASGVGAVGGQEIAGELVRYRIYEDDGKSLDRERAGHYQAVGSVRREDGKLLIDESVLSDSWQPSWSRRYIVVHAAEGPETVVWNGTELTLQEEETADSGLRRRRYRI